MAEVAVGGKKNGRSSWQASFGPTDRRRRTPRRAGTCGTVCGPSSSMFGILVQPRRASPFQLLKPPLRIPILGYCLSSAPSSGPRRLETGLLQAKPKMGVAVLTLHSVGRELRGSSQAEQSGAKVFANTKRSGVVTAKLWHTSPPGLVCERAPGCSGTTGSHFLKDRWALY